MKANTVYMLLGAAAVAGAVWYFKNKEDEVPEKKAVLIAASTFPTTKSPVEIFKTPGTLLQPTSGNTGIIPPVIQMSPPSEVAQAVQKPSSMKTIEVLKAAASLRKSSSLAGVSYLFN